MLHKLRPRLAVVAALAAVGLAVSACAGSSTGGNGVSIAKNASGSDIKGTIVFVAASLTDPFMGAMQNGAQAAAQQAGVNFKYLGATEDGPDLAQAMQQAIGSKPVAIAVPDWFPSAENPYIDQAIKAGIPVINVNAADPDWQSSGVLAYVGQNDYEAGQTAGKQFAAAGFKDVLCVDQVPGVPILTDRCDGLRSAMTAAGGTSKILNIPSNDQGNAQATQQDIQAALQTDKGTDGILTLGSNQAADAVSAASGNSKIAIGTFDLSTAVLNDVKSGSILFDIDQQPYLQGFDAVSALINYLQYKLRPLGQIKTGPIVLTKSNVNAIIQINDQYHGVLGAE